VNNAGAATYGHVVELDADVLTREVDLDVLAVVRLTRAVLPGLLERGSGGVLNVSSTASTGVAPALAAYAASKAFVDSWTRSLAQAVRGTGVTVVCVRPGYTRTRFHDSAGQDVSGVPGTYWLEPGQVAAQALAAYDRGLVTYVPRPGPVIRARALTRRRLTRLRTRLRSARR
jgi:short-subunit dehydrogenase